MNKTKKEILEKIKKNEIKMKPKWWFEALEDTKKSAVVIFTLAVSLMIGGIIYWWILENPLGLAAFGSLGWEMVWESFPKVLLVGTMLLFGLTFMVMSKIGENYKKTAEKLALIMALMVTITTAIVWIISRRWELEILLGIG